MKKRARFVLWAVLAIGVLSVAAASAFERFRYDDFQEARCEAGGSALRAALIGTFEHDHPGQRGAPYYLRIEVASQSDGVTGPAVLSGVTLRGDASGNDVHVRELKRTEIAKAGAGRVAVFVASPLAIPYEDYRLLGAVDGVAGHGVPFTCDLKRRAWSEWRMPLWDALMSV